MAKKWMILSALVVSLFLVGIALAAPNAASINWWVISGGGASETAGNTSLDGTLGQWAVGSDTAGTTQLGSGFWGGCSPTGEVDQHNIFLPLVLRVG